MTNPADRHFAEALESGARTGRVHHTYSLVEGLVADLLGGRQADRKENVRGPDILVTRPGSTPLAVEVEVLQQSSFSKLLANRTSELLASSLETGRAFRGQVTLSAVIILTASTMDSVAPTLVQLSKMVRQLMKAEDNIGYDSVLIGTFSPEPKWFYFTATPPGAKDTYRIHSTLSTENAFSALRDQQPLLHSTDSSPRRQNQRFLLVADEWQSGRGGISTFNRELSTALAGIGIDTAVFVPSASEDDVRSASDAGVALVRPVHIPGLTARELLLLRPVFAESDWQPDVIIGHGRLLGPYAVAQQQQFFPQASRVHVVHTAAEALEAAKESIGGDSHMSRANTRRELECSLAESADLVVGVGPLLTDTIRDDLLGPGPEAKVVCIVPGLREVFNLANAGIPVQNRVLFIGRADDFESKGVDLAAEALLRVVDRWPSHKSHTPTLVVRGVPDEQSAEVKAKLDSIFEARVVYNLRPYSDSENKVIADFAQARVLLMPSRHEGFGLAAFEGIACGLPVILSAESGLAQYLRESSLDSVPTSILSTRDTSGRLAVDAWADAIEMRLNDPEVFRTSALELRSKVGRTVSWKTSATNLVKQLE